MVHRYSWKCSFILKCTAIYATAAAAAAVVFSSQFQNICIRCTRNMSKYLSNCLDKFDEHLQSISMHSFFSFQNSKYYNDIVDFPYWKDKPNK